MKRYLTMLFAVCLMLTAFVSKISVDDVSILDSTGANIITLVTCVMDQPSYRWCVKAVETA